MVGEKKESHKKAWGVMDLQLRNILSKTLAPQIPFITTCQQKSHTTSFYSHTIIVRKEHPQPRKLKVC